MFNKILGTGIFILILIFYSFTYYHDMFFRMPYSIHDWAQSDRLSLAINFYDHGMNLFKPRVHNIASIDGIVGVEFPLQSYIAAALGFIFGRDNISTCFRFFTLLISCAGLTFLFLSCLRATRDFIFSMVPPLFIFCSPVYIFYTCNYLPDAASTSICFIAFYYLLDYLDNSNFKSLLLTIVWLTLAALIKTSSSLYLLGVVLFAFVQQVQDKKIGNRESIKLLLAVFISFGFIIGYFVYNRYLNKRYHSTMFLATIAPFKDMSSLLSYFNDSFKKVFLDEYFVLPQYLMFIIIVAPAIFLLSKDRSNRKQLWLAAIFLIGAIITWYLFGNQLFVHDYYILAIFFPLFAYMLAISVIAIYKSINPGPGRMAMRIALFSATLIIFFFADFKVNKMLCANVDGKQNFEITWAEGGNKVLDSLHIPKTEHVVVYDEIPPNTALLYLDRRGYSIGAWHIFSATVFAKSKDLRIIVCSTNTFNRVRKEVPSLFDFVKLKTISGKITVLEVIYT